MENPPASRSMLTLINTNRMRPPIAPIGLDYVSGAVVQAGFDVQLLDLNLATDDTQELESHFLRYQPALVGLSFRNLDDCFWPSGQSFLPSLQRDIQTVRRLSDAPIVLGGVGFSICPEAILRKTGADFGILGDGEVALPALLAEVVGQRRWERIPGLVYRRGDRLTANAPTWMDAWPSQVRRDFVDNGRYFQLGGQIGLETKRGCPRHCSYCVDPLIKGRKLRLKPPPLVANEVQGLLAEGIDVLHLCDAEFNLPPAHAIAVCDELVRRRLGERVRWYAYMTIRPFTHEMAGRMRRAGCVGINFTTDSVHPAMLQLYRQPHRRADIQLAVDACRDNGIAVMLDLLLGGPGETLDTVSETIRAVRKINPDCVGAALGIRLYPGTEIFVRIAAEGPLESNKAIRRHYDGPIDLLKPTFYISSDLGTRPALVVRDLIDGDRRFFPPEDESPGDATGQAEDHNYSDNQKLTHAIAAGARGAYWDILRKHHL